MRTIMLRLPVFEDLQKEHGDHEDPDLPSLMKSRLFLEQQEKLIQKQKTFVPTEEGELFDI